MAGASLAVDGFFHLLVSQLATRLLTFFLNLLSTRSLTPEAYGVAAVQFHLINTTILFVSREGFRRGCLRVGHTDPCATRKTLSVAVLTVPLGALLSFVVTAGLVWQQQGKADTAYRQALLMQGAAALLELCSEPLYILASTRLLFGLRISVETCATVAKGVVLLALVRGAGGSHVPPAVAFSWAQIAYAAVVCAGYAIYFLPQALAAWQQRKAGRRLDQGGAGTTSWVPDSQILHISGTFTLQAVEKLFLAEGGKMVVAAVQSPRSQGVYGLVTNLGSLVVRTLFQPFEEAAFTAFSKSGAAHAEPGPAPSQAGGDSGSGGISAPQQQQHLAAQWRLLSVLMRSIALVGLLAAAFGPGYSYLALLAAYSSRWADSEAPASLGLYSQYIALLAANGILEAFVHSVATQRQLQRINLWLVAFSGLHLGLSVAAVRAAGAGGLILADAANMAARITYCLGFVARRFAGVGGFRLRALLPSPPMLQVLGAALCMTCVSRLVLLHDSAGLWRWWEAAFGSHGAKASSSSLGPGALMPLWAVVDRVAWRARAGLHVLVGAACLAGVGAVLFRHERDVLRELRRVRHKED